MPSRARGVLGLQMVSKGEYKTNMRIVLSFCLSVAIGLAAFAGEGPTGPLRLKFGVITDVHISSSTTYFKHALEYFRDQSVDAVMICGDIADHGKVAELQLAADAYYDVFPDNQLPNGDPVVKLFVSGNHDYSWGNTAGNSDVTLLRSDFTNNWRTILREDDYSKIWQKTVKGYVFIGNNWDCTDRPEQTGCVTGIGVYADTPAYLAAHAAELSGTKPFFYVQHSQQLDTCFGTDAWGTDTGTTTTALRNFPNAVTFSGHSHFSLTDDRSIWQDGFTAINVGSLAYTGLDDADKGSIRGYENGYSGNAKMMSRYAREDGKQGLLVMVYDDAIVYRRLEFYGPAPRLLGEDWVQPLPAAGNSTDPYNYAKRSSEEKAPEFAAVSRLQLQSVSAKNRSNASAPSVKVSFPAANAGGGLRPYAYELKFTGAAESVVRKVLAQGFNMPVSDARAAGESYATLVNSDMPGGDSVTVEVTPLSSYGTRGDPLVRVVDGAALRGGTLKADGLSIIGF